MKLGINLMGPGNKKFNENYLEQNGVDAEEVKEEYVGGNGGHYDIYNGDTITIESKDGKDVIDTGMTKDEFFETYGNSEER
jgi:predicted membrane protein